MLTANKMKKYGKTVKRDLSKHCSFGIGGQADVFCPSSQEGLSALLPELKKKGFHVIGGGSNILCSDKPLKNIVISLNDFIQIEQKDGFLYCGSGVTAAVLLRFSMEHGLSGFEFVAGMPANVGGLAAMDASFKGNKFSDVIEKTEKVENIITAVYLRYQKSDCLSVRSAIEENIAYRKEHQEWGAKTAGCIFKNPQEDVSAGKLIDECGMKRLSKGDAMISEKHANFIVNRGSAKAADVVYLIEKIKEEVQSKKGILLEEEIVRIEC